MQQETNKNPTIIKQEHNKNPTITQQESSKNPARTQQESTKNPTRIQQDSSKNPARTQQEPNKNPARIEQETSKKNPARIQQESNKQAADSSGKHKINRRGRRKATNGFAQFVDQLVLRCTFGRHLNLGPGKNKLSFLYKDFHQTTKLPVRSV